MRGVQVKVLFWGTVMSTVHLVGWALLAWIPHLWLGCVTEFFAGLGFTSYPILISLCQASLDENSQGVGMGVVFAVKAATNIVGPLFFGLTYANLREGSHFFGGNCPQFPFLIGVALFVYALYVIRWRLQPLLEKGARDGARVDLEKPLLPDCAEALGEPPASSYAFNHQRSEEDEAAEQATAVTQRQLSAPLILRTALGSSSGI